MQKDIYYTDILIIGTGLGGCSTALAVSESNSDAEIIMLSKSDRPEETATFYAQGGIVYKGKDDSDDLLKRDIINAGAGLNYIKAVEMLCRKGPLLVKDVLLKRLNIEFSKDEHNNLDITDEAAHSIPRIIHVDDITGKAIQTAFIKYLGTKDNIKIFTNSTAIDLITPSHHSKDFQDRYTDLTCIGAYVLNNKSHKVSTIIAKETILATGGLGRLYLHTTNPLGSRGDGVAMSYRRGARIINMEFVQFHPTTLYTPEDERFLISESVRGEGGILINQNGKNFMDGYHPMGALAPRDIVARAIHEEMLKNNTDCVYLDISHKKAEWIKKRFPNIYKRCLGFKIDITSQPIPVVPSAHYHCGGIFVDKQGNTNIKNLKAVGEVACTGVHGANRLASTSMLECLVWGIAAGKDAAKKIRYRKMPDYDIALWKGEKEDIDPALVQQDWLIIKHTMWNYVGLVRSNKHLERANKILLGLQSEIESFYSHAKINDNLIGLRNGIQTALLILYAASKNRESIGCHYRH